MGSCYWKKRTINFHFQKFRVRKIPIKLRTLPLSIFSWRFIWLVDSSWSAIRAMSRDSIGSDGTRRWPGGRPRGRVRAETEARKFLNIYLNFSISSLKKLTWWRGTCCGKFFVLALERCIFWRQLRRTLQNVGNSRIRLSLNLNKFSAIENFSLFQPMC